ncbi:MAG: hypothetical protein IKU55_05550 [Clostridia bacterium]|nr:hypothetical protein [Clostridia bacterium]
MYLFDTHVHTAGVSRCAHLTAEETVDIYADLGYSGFCVTNHYSEDTLYNDIQEPTWEKTIEVYQRGYYQAKEYGAKRGLTVLFGMEMHISDYERNEYLVYGLTPEFVAANKDLWKYSLAELKGILEANNGMIFQAHPFRNNMVLSPAQYLDGIEAYNGNPRHNSRNDYAIMTAKTLGYGMVSGSDSHDPGDAGHGGLAFFECPKTEEDFVRILRSKRYALITSLDKI